ncbi:uncharacterized protein J4E92_004578 [Alternaria infectoria]|uniref:uncharacterized protein n=1 Tax=Alternaria infectoria TaxID=45303 RepID=UPI002220E548|nr:uncharacterized protein J4E92_004578 [Alternaria infectoria]KAI4930746.1 hypothetical protein J4E92_004578 [Alternaria infectoria]
MPALLGTDAMPEEEHNSDEVLGDSEGGEENYEAFETPAAETYAHLPKPICDNIHFCIQAIQTSHSEWKDAINAINTAFEARRTSLEEEHGRAKAQEAAFEKREALYIRLPTNQAVNLVHNALLVEHAQERVLIADMFRAIKIGKVDMRAARADGLTKAKEVYLRQRKTFSKLIEGLSGMAGKMKDERAVGERGSRSTVSSLAVRSPAPASYSQTTAHARTITPLPPIQIGSMATLSLLERRSGTNSELRYSPGASAAASTAMALSTAQRHKLTSTIKDVIRNCITAKASSVSNWRVERIKSKTQAKADTKALTTSYELLCSHGDDFNARVTLFESLTSYPNSLRPYFTRIEGDMEKELLLLNECSKHVNEEQARIEGEHKERKSKAYERCAEEQGWHDRQLHSLRFLAKTAGISLDD